MSGVKDVVVVGAGFAGLYAVHASRQRGLDVVCLEAGSGVGGTWYFNRYPGARCDVESIDYSYSFDQDLQRTWTWTERYAAQPEILAYINHVADRFDLREDICFDSRVASAHFEEQRALWQVTTDRGDRYEARHLIMATGSLSVPNKPDIDGIDTFSGDIYFTAEWPEESPDLAEKRVAVIGTGSSGIQSIPLIAHEAAELTVFQRTPNWSVPAINYEYTAEDQARIRREYDERRRISKASGGGSPHVAYAKRGGDCTFEESQEVLEKSWKAGGVLFGKTFPDQHTNLQSNDIAREFAERKIRGMVTDPSVLEKLIPDHPLGAKRICTDLGYFETFNRDHVRLVSLTDEPIEGIGPDAIATSKQSYPADVIVFATGFDALTGALTRIDITGIDGATISDAWHDGPRTYLGLAIPQFPNLFVINGPGSPSVLANMVMHAELQVDWVLSLIEYIKQSGHHWVDVREDSADKWTTHIDELAAATIFVKANSWYLGSNIDGKPRRFMLFTAGLGNYMNVCKDVADESYDGFVFGVASIASNVARH